MGASVPCDPVRVFFLIENRLLREALVRLFRKRPDFTVVGQSGERDLTIREMLQANCCSNTQRGAHTRHLSRSHLTLRQQQLVALVAKGLTNKEIAFRLHLSEFTVRNHVHRILRQLDAETRSEAVSVARASGYTISA